MSLDLGSSTWYQLVGNGRTEDQDQKKNQVTGNRSRHQDQETSVTSHQTIAEWKLNESPMETNRGQTRRRATR